LDGKNFGEALSRVEALYKGILQFFSSNYHSYDRGFITVTAVMQWHFLSPQPQQTSRRFSVVKNKTPLVLQRSTYL
jgi:hypothetical protein